MSDKPKWDISLTDLELRLHSAQPVDFEVIYDVLLDLIRWQQEKGQPRER